MQVLSVEQGLILLIPIFILFVIGLIVLFLFQTFAIWSNSELVFHPENIYYQPEGGFAIMGTILNLLEFIWGLCFLK